NDDIDPDRDSQALTAYADDHLADDAFTQAWLADMDRHLRTVAQPGGLFHDDQVTNTRWRGQTRRIRLLLYRWLGGGRGGGFAETEANEVYERLEAALAGANLVGTRMDGAAFHRWLLPWFNPAPATDDEPQAFYDRVRYPGDDAIAELAHYDLGEDVLHSCPAGDVDTGIWYFDGMPHRAIPVEELRHTPDIGHVTGEMARAGGNAYNAVMDRLPEDTIMVLTLVA